MESQAIGWSIALIIATACGPFLAVQAQKWIERREEKRRRKEWVFSNLMGYRATRLHQNFVIALNHIDLAFNGGSGSKRSQTEDDVIKKWRDLLNTLSRSLGDKPDAATISAWSATVDGEVTDLLERMAADLDYSFDRDVLRRGGYATRAAAVQEEQEAEIRHALVQLCRNKFALPVMNVLPGQNGELKPLVIGMPQAPRVE